MKKATEMCVLSKDNGFTGKTSTQTASSQSHSSVDDFFERFPPFAVYCSLPISLAKKSNTIEWNDKSSRQWRWWSFSENKKQTLQSMNQKTAERSSRMNEFDNKLLRAHNLHNQTGPREEIFVYFHHRSWKQPLSRSSRGKHCAINQKPRDPRNSRNPEL